MSTSDMRVTEALNDCLELIERGSTLEECLERYPDIPDELAPLLSMALETQQTAGSVHPSPEAQRAGLGAITEAWAAMEERRRRRERGPWRLLRRSWVLAAVVLLVLLFGGWTTATAAQDSVPGDTLYPVKQTQERVMLVVVFTRGGKADLHARLAEERTEEVVKLAEMGRDPVVVDEVTQRFAEHMNECVSLLGGRLSAQGKASSGSVGLSGPRGMAYGLSPDMVIEGTLSFEDRPRRFRHEGRFVRPWTGSGSERRAAMQERFFQQFQQFREMREGLSDDLIALHRSRMDEAFARSERLLLEAFLVMRELEDVQNPPE
ncbi:MAG: DUF5667 domain-containing protein [Chloroflexota bacterium]|nr:DUF5667 domain-containing protein [Chloroflexota bacterium]MDE2969761.1 DUF5667 domain-containing protein [Chloroflexota bacterium]